MDLELIERIARRMFEAHNNRVSWERCSPYIQRTYRRYAETALRAMMEG